MIIEVFDHMHECTPQEIQRLQSAVPLWRAEQAMRFNHLQGQYACLKSWEMLMELMQRAFGVDAYEHLEVEKNEHGKLFFRDYPDYCFNISHCKAAIAVAVAARPIGIDIEQMRRVEQSLIDYTMNDSEQRQIREANDPTRYFIRLWTQKEAALKCRGTGLAIKKEQSLRDTLSSISDLELHTNDNPAKSYIWSVAVARI